MSPVLKRWGLGGGASTSRNLKDVTPVLSLTRPVADQGVWNLWEPSGAVEGHDWNLKANLVSVPAGPLLSLQTVTRPTTALCYAPCILILIADFKAPGFDFSVGRSPLSRCADSTSVSLEELFALQPFHFEKVRQRLHLTWAVVHVQTLHERPKGASGNIP